MSRWTAAVALAALPSLGVAQTINIPGGSGVSPFGKPDTQTYGQTFVTPDATNTVLNDFSFWFLDNGATALNFQAYVYEWDQANFTVAGPALFTSAIMTGHGAGQVQVNTGSLALVSGTQYVAFFSSSGLAGSGTTSWESNFSNPYSDGRFVFYNNGDAGPASFGNQWDTWYVDYADARFVANFDAAVAVPEPSSVILMGTGLLGIVGGAYRRRKALQS